MDGNYPQWQEAKRLNRETGVDPKECRYLLLLFKTKGFQVFTDIGQTLRITRQPKVWFVRKFRKHKVCVEYVTFFNQKEIKSLGPVGTIASQGIVKRLLPRNYSNQTVFVCPSRLFKEIQPGPTYQAISTETFTRLLLE